MRVLTSNQLLENCKRNFVEVDGGVFETNPERGSVASHTTEADRLNEAAACNRAMRISLSSHDDLVGMGHNFQRRQSSLRSAEKAYDFLSYLNPISLNEPQCTSMPRPSWR